MDDVAVMVDVVRYCYCCRLYYYYRRVNLDRYLVGLMVDCRRPMVAYVVDDRDLLHFVVDLDRMGV